MDRRLVVLLLAASEACSGGQAAPPPGSDGATADAPLPEQDAGSPPPPGRSDAGLVLPPADVTVELPYQGPTRFEPIEAQAAPGRLDVHFSVDTTSSFADEIDAMQAGLGGLTDRLDDEVAEVSFGVSRFEDFPAEPFGAEGDRPFELLTPVTSERVAVAGAVADLDQPLGSGADPRESGAEALYQIATGEGRGDPFPIEAFDAEAASGGGELGGAGFREEALRLVVHVTDAPTHWPADYGDIVPGTHSLEEAVAALVDSGVKVIGIASRAPDAEFSLPRDELERVAIATGATMPPQDGACPTGIGGADNPTVAEVCPLVFDVNEEGEGLSETLGDSVLSLLATVAYGEVYGEVTGDRLAFVQGVEAVSAEPPAGAEPPTLADRRPSGDGIDDTFVGVATGTSLELRVHLRNETIPPEDYEQVFRVPVVIRGDGQRLVERVIRVVVPAAVPDGGSAGDGGSDGGGPNDGGLSSFEGTLQ